MFILCCCCTCTVIIISHLTKLCHKTGITGQSLTRRWVGQEIVSVPQTQ